jgi:hypothetical protein
MTMIYHNEYPAGHAVMQTLRAELGLRPPMECGPEARGFFDQLMSQTKATFGSEREMHHARTATSNPEPTNIRSLWRDPTGTI